MTISYWRATTFTAIAAGFLLLLLSCTAGKPTGPDAKPTSFTWIKYDKAIEQASSGGKHILIYFRTSWCSWCKEMETKTFKDSNVVSTIARSFLAAVVDGDSDDTLRLASGLTTEKELAQSYGVKGYPAVCFLEPDAAKISMQPGYVNAELLLMILDYIRTNSNERMTFQDYMRIRSGESRG